MKRAADKINEISLYLDELKGIIPVTIDEYKSSIEKKAACERYVEKIAEAATDLAFIVIKIKKLRIPEDDIDAFNILCENKIIDDGLSAKLKKAKGMRNIISHQYGKIDDGIIFESITEELNKDIGDFIGGIKKHLNIIPKN
jgi:uncharacterized protein YutE (UPF0331/DUF86 family)